MIKKVVKIGNSLGITLSIGYIKLAKIKAGDMIEVPETELVPFKGKKGKKLHLEGVTQNFVKLLDETIEEYKPALLALAKK